MRLLLGDFLDIVYMQLATVALRSFVGGALPASGALAGFGSGERRHVWVMH